MTSIELKERNRAIVKRNEDYLQYLKLNKNSIEQSWAIIVDMVNSMLQSKEYDLIKEIIAYLNKGNGVWALNSKGEARRLNWILQIMEMEYKYNAILLSEGCVSYAQLIEKYMLLTYALRRVAINLADESLHEAKEYLQFQKPSYIAISTILSQELIVWNNQLYKDILNIFSGTWSEDEIKIYRQLQEIDDYDK